MTGDTTPISDEAVLADIRLCLASYGFIAANQAEFLLAEVARLSAAPLLVSADSAQAERADAAELLCANTLHELRTAEAELLASHRLVEGLRAELAERDAKIRAIVAAIHAEIRDSYAAAVAPLICEAVDEAIGGLGR